jgi:elongation factor Ts
VETFDMAITAEQVKNLRDQTGAGMMECKNALTEAQGDVDQAVTILRKRGLAQAAKRAGRTTSEGLVGVKLNDTATTGVIAEVNCESDFVARTDAFQALVAEAIETLMAATSGTPQDAVGPESPLGQKLTATIAKTGENMAISRVARLDAAAGSVIGSYTHLGGKIGVLVEISGVPAGQEKSDAVNTLVKELAMHIAASNPGYATRDQVPADLVDKEKAVYRGQMENSGKPANVIEKIIEGKLGSYYSQVVLPDQPTIRDPKVSVSQMLAATGKGLAATLSVPRFVRFKVGEGA